MPGQKCSPMHERICFANRDGKQILFLDLSNCNARTLEDVMRKVPDIVATHAFGSVRVLTDLTGASFDDDAVMAIKEAAVFNKPYVKKSALVGTDGVPRNVYDAMKNFSRREWVVFQTRTEALDWLIES
jgi:hypothetical protein